MDRLVPIAEAAKHFDVSLRTLRFYEEKGMVSPHRTGSGLARWREYGPEEMKRLEFIFELKNAGFSLREIRDVIKVDDSVDRNQKTAALAERVRERLENDYKTLIAQVRALQLLRQSLSSMM